MRISVKGCPHRTLYCLQAVKVHVLPSPDFVKISAIVTQLFFYSFGLKLLLIVVLTNFSHSSNSSKFAVLQYSKNL